MISDVPCTRRSFIFLVRLVLDSWGPWARFSLPGISWAGFWLPGASWAGSPGSLLRCILISWVVFVLLGLDFRFSWAGFSAALVWRPGGTLVGWVLAVWGVLDWIQIYKVIPLFPRRDSRFWRLLRCDLGRPRPPGLPGPPRTVLGHPGAPEAFQGHSTPPRVSKRVLELPGMQPGLPCN